jgi:hypothetical protein
MSEMTPVAPPRPRLGHKCPICKRAAVPQDKATCQPCWDVLPGRLRRRLSVAWTTRETDPKAHTEALAAVLQWCRQWTPPTPNGGGYRA